MAIRNNASPYILPRRTPNNARLGTFIAPRNHLSAHHIQSRPTHLLSGAITKPSPQPLRVVARIIDPMTLGSPRQLFLTPASAVLSPAEQHSNVKPVVQDSFHHSFSRKQKAGMFKLAQDQSEEDEFDLDEVYQLLDESAGYRAQELGVPRRRERLSNLTAEEKMDRRKHKNRIAAQAARDRKKVNTHRLEESLRRALLEIGRLRGEVNLLKAENARLEAENQTIRFEQDRTGSGDSDNDTFQRHSKDEPMYYGDHLTSQRKGLRQFQPQPIQNHQQTIDVKPSFLVRSEAQQQQMQPQQKTGGVGQRDSVGSAASFHEPLQRERESSRASRSSGNGRPKWTEKRASVMACVAKVSKARDAQNEPGGAHGAVVGGEDAELQKIFDELFEDFDFPVDVDRFCNEIIEEGIAESSDAFGANKTGTTQQQQTNCGDICVPSTDATESQAQSSTQDAHNEQCDLGRQQLGVGRGQQQHEAFGSRPSAAAALSPHNYFVRPAPPAAPSSVCVAPVSISSSPGGTNSPSPPYQKVPSPCLSSHSTYIDEFATNFDDDQHEFFHYRQTDLERDPLLSSMKQEYLDQFDDHLPISSSYGLEESTDWTMNNAFESLGAEESCTLEEVAMSEDPNGGFGQQELLHADGPISFYSLPSSDSNHTTFLS